MKKTGWAPSNIAFVKYWGKKDTSLRLPLNDSLSMNIDAMHTTTTVEFSQKYTTDIVEIIVDERLAPMSQKESERVIAHLERIRQKTGCRQHAHVVTKNSFPMGVGAASSASGFAALTIASCAALGVDLSQKEMTILARLGSGSACRSIPDGFALWKAGNGSDDSYAYSVFPHTHWALRDVVVFVDEQKKSVSTTDGMEKAQTSPFLSSRLQDIPQTIQLIKQALEQKNIETLGKCLEREMFSMHAVMMTQTPPVLYWSDATVRVFRAIWKAREQGVKAYCTVDAGANVHVICEEKNAEIVSGICGRIEGVLKTVICRPAPGSHLVDTHLF